MRTKPDSAGLSLVKLVTVKAWPRAAFSGAATRTEGEADPSVQKEVNRIDRKVVLWHKSGTMFSRRAGLTCLVPIEAE